MISETLRASARAAAHINKGERPSRLDVPDDDTTGPSLSELAGEVICKPTPTYTETLEAVYVLEACLRNYRYDPGMGGAAIYSLYEQVSTTILPGADLLTHIETEEGWRNVKRSPAKLTEVTGSPETSSQELRRFVAISSLGTDILKYLDELLPLSDYRDHVRVIISLAAFTDIKCSWVSEASFANASYLLTKHHSIATKPHVLVDHILQELIRPLFARSKHPEITARGRKAMQPSPRIHNSSLLEAETKPWKFSKVYCVTVFRWALQNLEKSLVEANWPLVVPPILTLIDDDSTEYKAKGCELLTILLAITPPALLERTGLGEVFCDAVMPCLSYLPSLTPQDQSLRLLREAYPTLVALSRARYPSRDQQKERMEMLDQVLRKGVLKGHFHCSDDVRITEFLVNQIRLLVNEMGIWSVKHLKDLTPLLSDILSDPFGTAYPPLLAAAIQTLHTIILTGQPRIAAHRAEVLRGLAFCWLGLTDDEPKVQNSYELKKGLKDAVKLLIAAVQSEVDINADIKSLVHSDGRLTEFFDL
ncbi:MAG: hypothetical protein M1839_006794 [Geoglossum umbratile]|nr:MAG: hypothetical protein M1839_006794 [Geoglossum umbratile]